MSNNPYQDDRGNKDRSITKDNRPLQGNGVRPGGDDILDPAGVADPLFGCGFSRGTTASRPFAPCP